MGTNSTATTTARSGPRAPTVDQVVDEVLRAADQGMVRDPRGRRLTADRVRELHWSLGGYLRESLGERRLGELGARQLQELLDGLEDAGVSRRRLHRVMDALRTFYAYAIERGLVEADPAKRLVIDDEAPRAHARDADPAIARGLELATGGFALLATAFLLGWLA